jgi:hypothetical protein
MEVALRNCALEALVPITSYKLEASFDEDLLDCILEDVDALGSVDEIMNYILTTIGALVNEQLEEMVGNLNHDRYIMTEPDGYLDKS